MATINDVAKLANVSKSTVSNVVGDRKYVSEELRQRVLAACRELHYVPSFTATTLVTKKTGIIGLFLDIEKRYDDFYGDLIKGVFTQAKKHQYKILLYYSSSPDDMRTSLVVDKEPIDGAILLKPFVNDYRIDYILQDNLPYVLIGNSQKSVPSVDVDNRKIAYDITERLIGMGHKNFLFFTVDPRFSVANDRIEGFKQALRDNGLNMRGSKIVLTDHAGEEAAEILTHFYNEYGKYTAVLAPSDIVAKRLYRVYQENGRQVGKEISIAAMGGTEVAFDLSPQLTTVSVDYCRIGEECMELLYRQISNCELVEKSVNVDAKIIYTNSCVKNSGI